jgi:hypothetical protein
VSRWLALLGFAVCTMAFAWSPAQAQDYDTPLLQQPKKQILMACKTETKAHCARSEDTVSAQIACLRQYNVDLSLSCRHAISRLRAAPGRPG